MREEFFKIPRTVDLALKYMDTLMLEKHDAFEGWDPNVHAKSATAFTMAIAQNASRLSRATSGAITSRCDMPPDGNSACPRSDSTRKITNTA